MYSIGLKLWSVNTEDYYSAAMRLYHEGYFQYIELYVLPDSLEHLMKWKQLDIPYVIHCPHSSHGFNLADYAKREHNPYLYEQVRLYADELNADHVIFHGGCDGSIKETAKQLLALRESRALIENKPMKPLPESDGIQHFTECRGYSIDEIRFVMEQTGCGFCLDIGHAVCAANSIKAPPYDYLSAFMTLQPSMFHLTDLNTANAVLDSHPHLGDGALDFTRIIPIFPKQAFITLESMKNAKNKLTDFAEDVLFMRNQSKDIL